MELADVTYYVNGNEFTCQVSRDGRVFLPERKVEVVRKGTVFTRTQPAKEASYTETNGGYMRCVAGYVHRLVAKAYIPNPHNKRTVNHKDYNKKNNHCDNLEWMSQKENIHHYYKSEHAIGERNYAVELFDNGVSIGVFKSQLDAAKHIGAYKSSMTYLINGRYKKLQGRYTGKRVTKKEYYAKKIR